MAFFITTSDLSQVIKKAKTKLWPDDKPLTTVEI
ncbi:Uncharacterised protein [Yersinia pekkanenii]|uniref:Uncharacterized protein n=1 Tax=Yersinia pekkanenii TaxID=1288385 RepID=A0A0T9QPC0_9GAMM|nr:Uncharacterised protein [Yersinia pekkanenii]CRY66291.1 Uncharacterised protein [Yersinia pekkanenii]